MKTKADTGGRKAKVKKQSQPRDTRDTRDTRRDAKPARKAKPTKAIPAADSGPDIDLPHDMAAVQRADALRAQLGGYDLEQYDPEAIEELASDDPCGLGERLVPKHRLPPCSGKLARMVRDALAASKIQLPANPEPLPEEWMQKFIPDLAGLERKLGRIFLDALFCGNREFLKDAGKAFVEVDKLFDRTQVKAEAARIMPIAPEVGRCRTKAEARAMVERHLGRALDPKSWQRVQAYFGWETLYAKRGPKKQDSDS